MQAFVAAGALVALANGQPESVERREGGVQFAEVAGDTETGIVRVERVTAHNDSAVDLTLDLLWVHRSSAVMAADLICAVRKSHPRSPYRAHGQRRLEQYKLVGPYETPAIYVALLENYQAISATDA
jgi:xanthine dehydrogenase YagR molybdenum-binding subunit